MYLCGFDFYALRGAHTCRLDDGVVHRRVCSVFWFVLKEIDVDGAAEQGLEDDERARFRRYYVAFFAGRTVDAYNHRFPLVNARQGWG